MSSDALRKAITRLVQAYNDRDIDLIQELISRQLRWREELFNEIRWPDVSRMEIVDSAVKDRLATEYWTQRDHNDTDPLAGINIFPSFF